MSTPLRSPLKYIGGKAASAKRIVAAFPPATLYDRYVEPCCGACHVLFARSPSTHEEVVNDLNDNLITFWQEMQVHASLMQERLAGLLYSRKLYYTYYRSLFDGSELEPLERSIRWFYVLRSTGTGWMRKSPVGWDQRPSNIHKYQSALLLFESIQERLQGVAIDNRDVLATIKRYDSPRTLFYIDPPYFGAEMYYEASKGGFPHEEMAQLLQQVQGYVALSYYPHPDAQRWYASEKWRRVTWQQPKSSQIQLPERGDIATEMLLLNYLAPAQLWD